MKITDVDIAIPFYQYRVDINYYLERKPIVIEWAIVQAINIAEKYPVYRNFSVDMVFSQIFSIPDTDKLVRPVILAMADKNLIKAIALTDDTSLRDISMENLSLTDRGRILLGRGTLPSEDNTAQISFLYNIYERKAADENPTLLHQESNGFPLVSGDELKNVAFPELFIRGMLSDEQNKKKGKYNWLNKETRISSVIPAEDSETMLLWKNVRRELSFNEDMKCSIKGVNAPHIVELALQQLRSESIDADVAPDIEQIDDNYVQCRLSGEMAEVLKTQNTKPRGAIIRYDYLNEISGSLELSNNRILVAFGNVPEEKIDVTSNKTFKAYLKGEMLHQYELSLSPYSVVSKMNLKLLNNGKTFKLPVIVERKCESGRFDKLINTIVDFYKARDYKILFLSYLNGDVNSFITDIKETTAQKKSLGEKIAFIKEMNGLSGRYLKKKCISDDLFSELIFDEAYIRDNSRTVEGFSDVLALYLIDELKDRKSFMFRVIRCGIESLGNIKALEDTWRIIEIISVVGKEYYELVRDDAELRKRLYSFDVVNELFSYFDKGILSKKEYPKRGIEKSLVELEDQTIGVIEKFSGISLTSYSQETLRDQIVKMSTDELKDIYNRFKNVKEIMETVQYELEGYNEILLNSRRLNAINSFLKGMEKVLGIFYDARDLKYRKVVVIDTNALMSNPEILDVLAASGNYFVVIPAVVLDELDKNKVVKDESSQEEQKRAMQAREAARRLETYKAEDWLQLNAESVVGLLPKGSDINNADNQILSIALKYKAKHTSLVTGDKIFDLKVTGVGGIESFTADSFIKMLQHEDKTGSKKGKSKSKKKKK